MPGEHARRGGLQLLRLPLEVGALAAAPLRRIARELHPIDGEHLAADQSLLVADRQDGGEDVRDVRALAADERGDRREVRGARSTEGNEGHVVLAQPGDRPASHDPARVGAEHHLEQHRRGIRGGASRVVPEAAVEARQADGMVEQVVDRVLEGAEEELGRQVYRQQARVGVDQLVAGHGLSTAAGDCHRFAAEDTRRVARSSVSTAQAATGFSYSFVRQPLDGCCLAGPAVDWRERARPDATCQTRL